MAENETENLQTVWGQGQTSSEAQGQTKSRKRLRPLIIRLLDEGQLRGQGLVWQDRSALVWHLPWKNKKRSLDLDPDAVVIREIAKVMWPGEPKLSRWKELLRNALRSLKDIALLEEDKSKTYKVYQFLEEEIKGKKGLKKDIKEPIFDANVHKGMTNVHKGMTNVHKGMTNVHKGMIAQAFTGDDDLFADHLEDYFDLDNCNECATNDFRSRSPLQQSQSSDDSGITSSFADTPKSDSQDGASSSSDSSPSSVTHVVQYQPKVNGAGLPFSNLPNISNLLTSDHASDLNQMSLNDDTLNTDVPISDMNNLHNVEPSLLTLISHQVNEPVSANPAIQLSSNFNADLDNVEPVILDANSEKFDTAIDVLGLCASGGLDVLGLGLGASGGQSAVASPGGHSAITPVDSPTHHNEGRPLALLEVKYHFYPVFKYSITQPEFTTSFSDYCEKGENVCLPNPNAINELASGQKEVIYNFLTKQFKRGLFFQFKGDDLFATRYCKGGIVSQKIPEKPNGERLERHKETKIFSYEGFMNDLQKYKDSNGSSGPPQDHVTLLIGVSSSTHTVVPGRHSIISVRLHHTRAARCLREAMDAMFPTELPDGSMSDSYDRLITILENVKVSQ